MKIYFHFLVWLFFQGTLFAQTETILTHNGHSHNDYTRRRPLLDALDNYFLSVEVDVFSHKGKLVVSHIPLGLNLKKDIAKLYFQRLEKRIKDNSGYVYEGHKNPLTIYIDFKNGGICELLKPILKEYQSLLTVFGKDGQVLTPGPLIIDCPCNDEWFRQYVVKSSGPDFRDKMRNEHYGNSFSWNGQGEIPTVEKEKLIKLVEETHKNGQSLRLYAAPQNDTFWKTMIEAGVDWMNCDDLDEYRRFYLGYYQRN